MQLLQLRKRLIRMQKHQSIDPKLLKIRSKVELAYAQNNQEVMAFIGVKQKSRVLVKDVAKFDDILAKMVAYVGMEFTQKSIVIEAPLCSKAKKALELQGWNVEHTAV